MTTGTGPHAGAMAGLRDIPGVRVRAYAGAADHPAMVALNNRTRIAAGNDERVTVAGFDADYAHLVHCDPARDIVLVERGDALVAYGRVYWEDRSTRERSIELVLQVDPEARGIGIEDGFVAWAGERADAMLAAEPTDRPAILAAYHYGGDEASAAAFVRAGMRQARRHLGMRRPSLDGIPDLRLPDGLQIRPIDAADEPTIARVAATDLEVFSEHWGGIDSSGERWAAFRESPAFDPSLWRVAFDGDEIAGQILSYLDPPDEDGIVVGWTEAIAVRRPYRRRGLASALLAASLRAVRDRGASVACLGVDAENPNQALTLYRRLGFEVRSEMLEHHRPLRGVGR